MREKKIKKNKDEIHALIDPYKWILIMSLLFFISAGRLDIPRAWLFFVILIIGSTISSLILWKLNRELLQHRTEVPPDTKSWDKVFLLVYFSLSLAIVPIIAGLDVGRFYWSELNHYFMIIGLIFQLLSYILIVWAMVVNRHFEGTARIQEDRAHKVVQNGPYKIMRHPGYLGMVLGQIAFPFIVGSLFSLVPAGIAIVSTLIRTSLEDKMLKNELEGYAEYAKKVKKRILPGIW